LTAIARDTANNKTTSSAINFTVSNTSPPPVTGAAAAYGFSEGSGTTTADNSGNGNTGTLSGATWSSLGQTGDALSFNGSNNRVNVANSASFSITSAMTIEAWVYPTALTSWRTVMMKERSGGLVYALYAHDGAAPAVYIRIGSTDIGLAGNSALPLNSWSHLAATYDGANLRLYVNGVQVASKAKTGSIATSTTAFRIGGNAVWGEWFAGRIDDARIYKKALSPAEIQSDMANPLP